MSIGPFCRYITTASLLAIVLPASAANLYDAKRSSSWLTDSRAMRTGDALTVVILEVASAETRASSTEQNDYRLQAGLSDTFNTIGGSLDFGQDGLGRGVTTRAGTVRAQITVRVNDQLENGDLVIGGTQSITVNGEEQRISLEGLARPVDIGANNTILSTRLMNARISFSGQGWVTETQNPGWFRRILRFLGL